MQRHKIRAVRGCKKHLHIAWRPSISTPNQLQREFTVDAPNKVWATDITYIRTSAGETTSPATTAVQSHHVVDCGCTTRHASLVPE